MPSLLPDEPELEQIHTRDYETKVYRVSDDELLVRGVVSDRKPPGLYVVDDPDELEVHQMIVELRVAYPSLEITKASVVFESHPHANCPMIAADYEKLVGLSIARGFLRKTKDLFGGASGCTHTNALIQAMAPAIVQSTWSIRIKEQMESGIRRSELSREERESRARMNRNTCHLWSESGERYKRYTEGSLEGEVLIPVVERLKKLGREDDPHWG
ncbi:MAG: hypothetical protein CL931_06705 [Deltaproteobacteria bacterium]|nr:hypothetical protein [Deltaproteobacteria bacterium]